MGFLNDFSKGATKGISQGASIASRQAELKLKARLEDEREDKKIEREKASSIRKNRFLAKELGIDISNVQDENLGDIDMREFLDLKDRWGEVNLEDKKRTLDEAQSLTGVAPNLNNFNKTIKETPELKQKLSQLGIQDKDAPGAFAQSIPKRPISFEQRIESLLEETASQPIPKGLSSSERAAFLANRRKETIGTMSAAFENRIKQEAIRNLNKLKEASEEGIAEARSALFGKLGVAAGPRDIGFNPIEAVKGIFGTARKADVKFAGQVLDLLKEGPSGLRKLSTGGRKLNEGHIQLIKIMSEKAGSPLTEKEILFHLNRDKSEIKEKGEGIRLLGQ